MPDVKFDYIQAALSELSTAELRGIRDWLDQPAPPQIDSVAELMSPRDLPHEISRSSIFEVVFDKSYDAIIVGSPEGVISAANPAACRLFGMTEDEICQAGRRGLAVYEDPRLRNFMVQARDKGSHEGEILFRRKDGSRFVGEVSLALFDDETGKRRTVVIIRDRTEKLRHEESLRQSEERFRLTFDQSPLGTAILGLDYRLVKVNEALGRITGYDPAELLDLYYADLVHPDDLDLDWQQARELKAGRIDRYAVDKRFVRKDGSTVWIHLSSRVLRGPEGEPLCFVLLVTDISERKAHEEQAKVLNERLALATRAASIGIWDWDLRTDQSTWDHRMFEIYGLPGTPSVTREAWRNLVHPDDLEQAEASLQSVIDRREPRPRAFRIIRPDGVLRHIEAIEAVIESSLGDVVRIVGVNIDVTERKRGEKERESLIVELRRALADVRTLSGLVPVCAWCKRVRDDAGYWERLESYIRRHTDARVTHGICDDCLRSHSEKSVGVSHQHQQPSPPPEARPSPVVRFGSRRYGKQLEELKAQPAHALVLVNTPDTARRSAIAAGIAADLGAPLYRIDLSSILSSLTGETEKNLGRVFETANATGAVLFFDDADALFSQRSDPEDGHQCYSEQQRRTLLQHLGTASVLPILIGATTSQQSLEPLRNVFRVIVKPGKAKS